MNSLEWLQNWYAAQCNGDWEHQYGVLIQTLDHPGWTVTVDLAGTPLEGFSMTAVSTLTGISQDEGYSFWLHCKVENNRFTGAGGLASLFPICEVFRHWAELQHPPSAALSN